MPPESPPPAPRRVLIVQTRSLDSLNDILTSVEQTLPGPQIQVIDLTVPAPDYRPLLAAVFEADSVQVW